jgi:multicomponent Na+:H+ antiporter subunit E
MPILFLAFWIILNARITLEVVIIGLVVAALMSLFAYKAIGISPKREMHFWAVYGRYLIIYPFLLIVNVVKSNLQMIRIILSPKIEISPRVVYFKSPVKSVFSKIFLMYSIALTPGTILFELEEDRFGIHAITADAAKDINNTSFARKLKKIEREEGNG